MKEIFVGNRGGSNPRPSESQSDALTNWATEDPQYVFVQKHLIQNLLAPFQAPIAVVKIQILVRLHSYPYHQIISREILRPVKLLFSYSVGKLTESCRT